MRLEEIERNRVKENDSRRATQKLTGKLTLKSISERLLEHVETMPD